MNNLSIKYFQQELYKVINNCGLPVGTAYFVLKDILNELEKTFNDCVYEESKNSQNTNTETINIPQNTMFKEEKENEGTNANASEYSGSTNDN